MAMSVNFIGDWMQQNWDCSCV